MNYVIIILDHTNTTFEYPTIFTSKNKPSDSFLELIKDPSDYLEALEAKSFLTDKNWVKTDEGHNVSCKCQLYFINWIY